MTAARWTPGAVALLCALAAPAGAQLMASEPASVTQTVDGTRLDLRYSRPRLRGRRGVIGTAVPWGYVWTAGANASTTLAVSRPVMLEGQPVAAGRYSLWLVPARTGPWELVLDHDTTLFHTQGPPRRAGQVRVPVTPTHGPLTEVLTWSFPEVSGTGATLAMQWDTVAVALHVRVAPTSTTAVAADVASPLVGRYQLRFSFPESHAPPPAAGAAGAATAAATAAGGDTTRAAVPPPEAPAREVRFEIRHEGGELRARMTPPLFRQRDGYADWILAPRRPGYYALGRLQGGEIAEYVDEVLLTFIVAGGRATGFEIRGADDARMAVGTRVP